MFGIGLGCAFASLLGSAMAGRARWFAVAKDGGPESHVTGYWLVECKTLFSIVLLRFDDGTRDAYHTHAFNALSWVLRGHLVERYKTQHGTAQRWYLPSLVPILTRRERFHQVQSRGTSWVLSLRGPWVATWREGLADGRELALTYGRREVAR
jgi:hypothetical protein